MFTNAYTRTVDLVCHRYFEDKAAQDPNFHYKPVVIGGENPQCVIPEVQRNVAAFTLILSVVIGTLSSVTAPKLGALSDRYGRRLLMSLCPIGGISSEFITVLAAKYPQYVRYEWLILGAVLEGLSGSFTAGNVLIHSYTSDCTPPSQRSVAIGYLHSCLFGGLALGPLLAGYFVKWTGSLISVFYVLLGSHIMYAIYARFGLPESLSKKRQLAAREKHAREKEQLARNPIPDWAHAAIQVVPFGAGDGLEDMVRTMRSANPFEPLRILFPKGPDAARLRRNLLTLAIIDMALLGTAMSSGQVTVLYTEFMFGWGTLEASRFISLVSAVRVLVLVAIFPVVNYIFRTLPARAKARQELQAAQDRGDTTTGLSSDRTNSGADKLDVWVLRAALISDVVGITGYVLSRTEVPFVLSACTAAVGGLGSATIQASLSKHVPAERVGQLLGAIGLLHALSRVLFPILFNGLYAATVLTYPQAFFVLLLVIFVGLLGASFLVRPHGMFHPYLICPYRVVGYVC